MEKTTFKVELEIVVEYDVPEGVSTTPYTSAYAYGCGGKGIIVVDKGNIIDAEVKKLERKE